MNPIQLSLFGDDQEVIPKPKLPYALEVLTNREPPPPDAPIVVSYGGGRNSTAMVIGMWSKGIIPDLILFTDTGGEKPETYEYLQIFSDWLASKSMPPVTVTSREMLGMDKHGRYTTLEGYCLANQTLPSKAYGGSTCSLHWKAEPQEKFVKTWSSVKKIWGNPLIRKMIGFHAGEASRIFNRKSGVPYLGDNIYFNEYPLILWGWHQGHCEAVIQASGLPMPPKSACFYCPNMRPKEIRELAQKHPDLLDRAIALERNAADKNTKVKGLGREFSWEDLIESSKPNEYFVNSVIPDCMCNDG